MMELSPWKSQMEVCVPKTGIESLSIHVERKPQLRPTSPRDLLTPQGLKLLPQKVM